MSRTSLAVLIAGCASLVVWPAHGKPEDKPETDSDDVISPIPARIELLETKTRSPTPVNPWFVRPPFSLTAGSESNWKLTIYGFAEADVVRDSTRSFNDGVNNNVVAHALTQAGDNPRLQGTIRNSRIGFKAEAPDFGGARSTGVIEFDLFGNQPKVDSGGGSPAVASGPGATTEAAYFNNAALRVRHAYVKIESNLIDVLAGQTYHLLGWQNYFFGATCAFLGLPNGLFNRTMQLRLNRTLKSESVDFDVAVGAFRPVQRDSGVPDVQGGLRLLFNRWKGITTPGSGGTNAAAAALGLSGLVRSFKVDPYAPLPAPPIPLAGWAVAVNVLVPIIPVRDSTDRGNALTLTGEFVIGTGAADQYTGMTAGATMPNVYPLPIGTPVNALGMAVPPQVSAGAQPIVGLPYVPNIDPGLVAFDSRGFLHTINWQTFVVGLQYYLPPNGRVFVSGNYSQGRSNNIASLYHPVSARQPWINALGVFRSSRYMDGNIFFDVTPPVRLGLSFQRVEQELADDTRVHNDRFEMTFLYFL